MNTIDLLGIFGLFFVFFAFIMLKTERWDYDEALYDIFSLVGCIFLLVYAFILEAWVFFVLNAVWAIVSGVEAHKDYLKKGF